MKASAEGAEESERAGGNLGGGPGCQPEASQTGARSMVNACQFAELRRADAMIWIERPVLPDVSTMRWNAEWPQREGQSRPLRDLSGFTT